MSMTEEAQITNTGNGDERNVEIKYEFLCCAFVSGSQSFRHKVKIGGKTQKIPRNKRLSFILLGAKYSQQRVWHQSEKRRNQDVHMGFQCVLRGGLSKGVGPSQSLSFLRLKCMMANTRNLKVKCKHQPFVCFSR